MLRGDIAHYICKLIASYLAKMASDILLLALLEQLRQVFPSGFVCSCSLSYNVDFQSKRRTDEVKRNSHFQFLKSTLLRMVIGQTQLMPHSCPPKMQILTFLACDTHYFCGRFHFLTLTPYCHWHAVQLSRIPFFQDDFDTNQVSFVYEAQNRITFLLFYANRRPPSFLAAFTAFRLQDKTFT